MNVSLSSFRFVFELEAFEVFGVGWTAVCLFLRPFGVFGVGWTAVGFVFLGCWIVLRASLV